MTNRTDEFVLGSIQVGLPRPMGNGDRAAADEPWTSAFVKDAVRGPVTVTATNIVGDGQADRLHHGGPDQAVLAYAADHYDAWRAELSRPDFPHGAFGENLTVAGLDERVVCIGDSYAVGSAVLQVSCPRIPCWKISRRWEMPALTARVEKTGRTGWYLRVLEEGEIEAGQVVSLIDRPYPEWTVTRAHRVLRQRRRDPGQARDLSTCSLLAKKWRDMLATSDD